MDNNNISAMGRKRRGRPDAPLEVEIEFIDDGTASERWNKIFELLETAQHDSLSPCSDNPKPEQMTLF